MANIKVMVTTVLIIAAMAVVFINISPEAALTGKALLTTVKGVSRVTTVSVDPLILDKAGNKITITINPGSQGAYKEIKFTEKGSGRRVGTTSLWCLASYKCFTLTKLNYVTGTDWKPGNYYVNVYDYGIKDWVAGDFTIAKASKVETPEERQTLAAPIRAISNK